MCAQTRTCAGDEHARAEDGEHGVCCGHKRRCKVALDGFVELVLGQATEESQRGADGEKHKHLASKRQLYACLPAQTAKNALPHLVVGEKLHWVSHEGMQKKVRVRADGVDRRVLPRLEA